MLSVHFFGGLPLCHTEHHKLSPATLSLLVDHVACDKYGRKAVVFCVE